MKLSVVIVNHNNCSLLKQGVHSLIEACKGIDYELFIVDNGSADHSTQMLEHNFPEIPVIANAVNVGIARARNQGLRDARGEYVLLINADTICSKDTVLKLTAFLDEHKNIGAASVRMLSPKGQFLPESIHGLSPIWAKFLKLIGFARHLSKTRLYDRNRKDWVEEFQVTEIDIVNGDFMFLRRAVLADSGFFDERFFVAGYDIDLSYRIRLAGFKNYYFPKTYVINYQTLRWEKFSWKYIKHFYGAMFIFALKYLLKLPQIKVEGVPQLFSSSYEVK